MTDTGRKAETEAAKAALPKSSKRRTKKKPGRHAPNAIRRNPAAQAKKYGKPKTYRMPLELVEAIDRTALKHRVSPRDVVVYLLANGLSIVEQKKVNLPVRWDEQKRRYVIDDPEFPDISLPDEETP